MSSVLVRFTPFCSGDLNRSFWKNAILASIAAGSLPLPSVAFANGRGNGRLPKATEGETRGERKAMEGYREPSGAGEEPEVEQKIAKGTKKKALEQMSGSI